MLNGWMKRDSIVNLLGQLSLVITVFLLEDFLKYPEKYRLI